MRTLTIAGALAVIAAAPALAQKPVTPAAPPPAQTPRVQVPTSPDTRLQLEFTGGLGYTIVSMGSWAGTNLNNWNQVAYWGSARLLLPVGTDLKVGVELGYHYLFWYTYYVGPPSYNYQYNVNSTDVGAMLRLPVGVARRFTLDLGGAFHSFNNAGTHVGALAALNYAIPAGKITVPVGLRADFIFTNPMLVPVALNAGVRLSL
jgi:hypothetical protein